jgi:DNA-binding GntR family transcriptional regulator
MDQGMVSEPTQPRLRAAELSRRIEHDINVGTLPMGAWLKQVDLEEQYACNRILLRQALDRLVEKGLVRQIANRGYRVEDLDPRRMAELRDIRAILEVAAAGDVMVAIDECGLAAMQDAAEQFDQSVMSGTVTDQEAANMLFHTRMLAYCSNRELVAMIFDLRARVPLVFTRQRNTGTLMRSAARHHFAIIERLRSRNLAELREIMRLHVMGDFIEPSPAAAGE